MRRASSCLALLIMGIGPFSVARAADDSFSEIHMAVPVVPQLPDPDFSTPRVIGKLDELSDPRSHKKAGTDCGSSFVAIHVRESGEVDEVKPAISSGFTYLDEVALRYVRDSLRYSPAHFEGKPMAAWALQSVKFAHEDITCTPRVDAESDARRLSAEYAASLTAMVEQARAKNREAEAEQLALLEKQAQARYAREEPYRRKPAATLTLPLQAMLAIERHWNLLHCGASRYDVIGSRIIEYRGAKFRTGRTEALSSIDRANGHEWRGTFVFECEMRRSYSRHDGDGDGEPGWGEWQECDEAPSEAGKKKGKWQVRSFRDEEPRRWLTCADIPPG